MCYYIIKLKENKQNKCEGEQNNEQTNYEDRIVDSDIANCLGAAYYSCVPDVMDMLNDQPTAYDVEKVVKELEDLKMRYFLTIANTGDADKDCAYLNIANDIDIAIEIIKRGGRDEE